MFVKIYRFLLMTTSHNQSISSISVLRPTTCGDLLLKVVRLAGWWSSFACFVRSYLPLQYSLDLIDIIRSPYTTCPFPFAMHTIKSSKPVLLPTSLILNSNRDYSSFFGWMFHSSELSAPIGWRLSSWILFRTAFNLWVTLLIAVHLKVHHLCSSQVWLSRYSRKICIFLLSSLMCSGVYKLVIMLVLL